MEKYTCLLVWGCKFFVPTLNSVVDACIEFIVAKIVGLFWFDNSLIGVGQNIC